MEVGYICLIRTGFAAVEFPTVDDWRSLDLSAHNLGISTCARWLLVTSDTSM